MVLWQFFNAVDSSPPPVGIMGPGNGSPISIPFVWKQRLTFYSSCMGTRWERDLFVARRKRFVNGLDAVGPYKRNTTQVSCFSRCLTRITSIRLYCSSLSVLFLPRMHHFHFLFLIESSRKEQEKNRWDLPKTFIWTSSVWIQSLSQSQTRPEKIFIHKCSDSTV